MNDELLLNERASHSYVHDIIAYIWRLLVVSVFVVLLIVTTIPLKYGNHYSYLNPLQGIALLCVSLNFVLFIVFSSRPTNEFKSITSWSDLINASDDGGLLTLSLGSICICLVGLTYNSLQETLHNPSIALAGDESTVWLIFFAMLTQSLLFGYCLCSSNQNWWHITLNHIFMMSYAIAMLIINSWLEQQLQTQYVTTPTSNNYYFIVLTLEYASFIFFALNQILIRCQKSNSYSITHILSLYTQLLFFFCITLMTILQCLRLNPKLYPR